MVCVFLYFKNNSLQGSIFDSSLEEEAHPLWGGWDASFSKDDGKAMKSLFADLVWHGLTLHFCVCDIGNIYKRGIPWCTRKAENNAAV